MEVSQKTYILHPYDYTLYDNSMVITLNSLNLKLLKTLCDALGKSMRAADALQDVEEGACVQAGCDFGFGLLFAIDSVSWAVFVGFRGLEFGVFRLHR